MFKLAISDTTGHVIRDNSCNLFTGYGVIESCNLRLLIQGNTFSLKPQTLKMTRTTYFDCYIFMYIICVFVNHMRLCTKTLVKLQLCVCVLRK